MFSDDSNPLALPFLSNHVLHYKRPPRKIWFLFSFMYTIQNVLTNRTTGCEHFQRLPKSSTVSPIITQDAPGKSGGISISVLTMFCGILFPKWQHTLGVHLAFRRWDTKAGIFPVSSSLSHFSYRCTHWDEDSFTDKRFCPHLRLLLWIRVQFFESNRFAIRGQGSTTVCYWWLCCSQCLLPFLLQTGLWLSGLFLKEAISWRYTRVTFHSFPHVFIQQPDIMFTPLTPWSPEGEAWTPNKNYTNK